MLAEIPTEQTRSVVEGVARDVLAEAGVFMPPVDAVDLARRLGIVVAGDGAAVGVRARFVRLGGAACGLLEPQPAILVADDPRPERRQWAIAHEIGEHQAHRVFAELGVDVCEAAPGAREAVANRLAGCLLLPYDWLLADGIDLDWDLVELKARYATASHELIARRMLDMPPPVIVTLFDHGQPVWRRANRPGPAPPLTAAERAVQRAAHDLLRPARCERSELPDELEDVRAWPIHEPAWKREILRTQVRELE